MCVYMVGTRSGYYQTELYSTQGTRIDMAWEEVNAEAGIMAKGMHGAEATALFKDLVGDDVYNFVMGVRVKE